MLSISDAQALVMASTSETGVFTRGALRRGFNAVLSTLASTDAPQAPQLVRGSCDPESAPGSHCYGVSCRAASQNLGLLASVTEQGLALI